MGNWKQSLKNKFKKGINQAVDKGVVGAVNTVGRAFESHPDIPKALAQGMSSSAIGIAGRKITKDQILAAAGKCGKSGAVGAAIDGVLGASQAGKMYYSDLIDKDLVIKHVAHEAACGFISSTAGTCGTVTVVMITGSMGPAALLVGMGSSVGARYIYRSLVDGVLPDLEDLEEEENEEDLEKILDKIEETYKKGRKKKGEKE